MEIVDTIEEKTDLLWRLFGFLLIIQCISRLSNIKSLELNWYGCNVKINRLKSKEQS